MILVLSPTSASIAGSSPPTNGRFRHTILSSQPITGNTIGISNGISKKNSGGSVLSPSPSITSGLNKLEKVPMSLSGSSLTVNPAPISISHSASRDNLNSLDKKQLNPVKARLDLFQYLTSYREMKLQLCQNIISSC